MLYDFLYGIRNNPKWHDRQRYAVELRLHEAMESAFDRIPKVIVDFETFYDPADKYTLRSKGMTYEKYVRDPRFQVILCSFVIPETGERYWVPNYKGAVRKELEALQLSGCNVIAHNNAFDGFILSDYYGIEPLEYSCTMTMARPLHGARTSGSLADLAKRYGLPEKLDEIYNVAGMRLEHFDREALQRYGDYGMRDSDLLAPLYGLFRAGLQEQDMITISDALRAGSVCQFELNAPLLEAYLPRLVTLQEERVQRVASVFGEDMEAFSRRLSSNEQFADILRGLGVTVPMKESKTATNPDGTPKVTYAFSKNDMGFKEILQSGDPLLESLCEARIGEKSTIGKTRAESLIGIAQRGRMPFPVKPFGTGTSRFAGYQGINAQNFPKRGGDITLRQAMQAPEGYSVVTCDLSQIEARRMADHAGQMDLLKQFENNEDPYSDFATKLYGYTVSKSNGRKKERNVGKEGILSLQFGSWVDSFYLRLRTAYDLDVTKEFCKDAVLLYRRNMSNIVHFWEDCDYALHTMLDGGTFRFGRDKDYVATKGRITLPDGWAIRYDDLRMTGYDELNRPIITYTDMEKRKTKKVYRGIIANNVTQGSAARILQWQMMQLRNEGIIWAGTVHDELIFIIPNHDLAYCAERIQYWMRQRPAWAPHTPIDCELTVGPNYGDQYELSDWLASGCNQAVYTEMMQSHA